MEEVRWLWCSSRPDGRLPSAVRGSNGNQGRA